VMHDPQFSSVTGGRNHQPFVEDASQVIICIDSRATERLAKLGANLLKTVWALPEHRTAVLDALPPALIKSIAGALNSKARRQKKGAVAVLRKCPYCAFAYGAREMRRHKPRCPRSPYPSRVA
jgi:hypothetical protein